MTTMRVTQRMLSANGLSGLQAGLHKLSDVQQKLNTGRVINKPSDDPSGSTAAMQIRKETAFKHQILRNVDDGQGWLTQADTAISSVISATRRARELALQGANTAATSQTSRDALAEEVAQLNQAVLGYANSKYLTRPIFGGNTANTIAYDNTGTFQGDPGSVNRVVEKNTTVQVDTGAEATFGAHGDNLFNHLSQLSVALKAGDTTQVRSLLGTLEADLERLSTSQASVGARALRLDQIKSTTENSLDTLGNSLASIESTDLPATIVELQMAEVAYQATLGVTARITQPTLLDFLR